MWRACCRCHRALTDGEAGYLCEGCTEGDLRTASLIAACLAIGALAVAAAIALVVTGG